MDIEHCCRHDVQNGPSRCYSGHRTMLLVKYTLFYALANTRTAIHHVTGDTPKLHFAVSHIKIGLCNELGNVIGYCI